MRRLPLPPAVSTGARHAPRPTPSDSLIKEIDTLPHTPGASSTLILPDRSCAPNTPTISTY
eukprot:2359823-Pleurochrysis_carterae.AAC.1